ncbi:MAG TPA: hypothetical protein VGR96_12360 [Acidobacteriaceae bacterium]|nr:hypothetical protein [Acidobacteriaceae bacterium]
MPEIQPREAQRKQEEAAAEERKRLDRAADDAAKSAGETEKRYDEDHSIFTK